MTEAEYNDDITIPASFADLWRAVVISAIQDAVAGVQMTGSKAQKIRATHDARDYILNYNRDFNEVCSLAGLDSEAVRERVARQIKVAPTPEELFADRKQAINPFINRKRPKKARVITPMPSIAPGQDSCLDALEPSGDGTQEDEHQSDRNEIRNKHLYHEKSGLPERVDKRRHGEHHQHVSDETETVAEHNDSSGLCLITVGTDRLTQPYNAPGGVRTCPLLRGPARGGPRKRPPK